MLYEVITFIAVTYLMNYYSEHNLKAAPVELPLVTDTLHIKKQLHLMQVAEVLNISIEQLRDLNPQYRSDIIPAGSKQYSLSLVITSYSIHYTKLYDTRWKFG